MKTALPGIAWLPADVVAELYTLELRNGTKLYYTSLDVDIVYRNQTYRSDAFNLERGPIKSSVGVEVDDVELTIYSSQEETIQDVSFPHFVVNRGFNGAWMTIERARQSRVTHLFKGIVTDVGADVTQIKLTLSAPTVLMNIDMPHNQYSSGCIWSVYNAGCALDRAAHAVNGTVAVGSYSRVIHCDLTQANGFFDLGKIEITSGANIGSVRTVRDYFAGTVVLAYPLPTTPSVSDTFTIWSGCDKRYASCQAYNNQPRYRGFPYMPKKESSI